MKRDYLLEKVFINIKKNRLEVELNDGTVKDPIMEQIFVNAGMNHNIKLKMEMLEKALFYSYKGDSNLAFQYYLKARDLVFPDELSISLIEDAVYRELNDNRLSFEKIYLENGIYKEKKVTKILVFPRSNV
jgi:hypothetical protein